MRHLAAVLCAVACLASEARAQLTVAELYPNVKFEQRLNEPLPLTAEFVDESGKTVHLGDYFGQRPVIVTLVYYDCPMLCTVVLNGLIKALRTLPFHPAQEFDIVTVSISPSEGPALAAAKKASYIKQYGRPGAADGWHFLTGKKPSIDALAQAEGFRYVYDANSGEYAHAGGIVLATPDGHISRYFYGFQFDPRDIRLGLVDASAGKIGSPVDHFLLLCYRYDPVSGRYGVVVMNVVRLSAIATVLGLGALILVLLRRERRRLGT